MRDILFRAKRLDAGGAWAEGYFVSSGNGTNEIIPKDSYWDFYEGFYPEYEVDPDTLGQFTGLTDRNGRKIFEGDIVRFKLLYHHENNRDWVGRVIYRKGAFQLRADSDMMVDFIMC